MNEEIKVEWLAALRSGKYQQGKSALRIENNFCCLGVLCDLHAKANDKEWCFRTSHSDYLGCTQFLPNEVSVWAGLPDATTTGYRNAGAFFDDDGKEVFLSTLNDEGKTFNEIADIIEKRF